MLHLFLAVGALTFRLWKSNAAGYSFSKFNLAVGQDLQMQLD